jgi:hypothetical protein
MIAYNNLWLNNSIALSSIENAFTVNLITKYEYEATTPLYKVEFYSPNLFVRIGLFILTTIVLVFSLGLFSLLFLSAIDQHAVGILLIFFGLVCYASLEWFVASRQHYKSGVDDALLWISAAFIVAGINVSGDIGAINNAVLIFLLAAWFTLRFADWLMTIVAIIALLAFIFFLLNKMGNNTKAITPFALMFTAAFLFFICRKLYNLQLSKFYGQCLTMGIVTCLLCFYIAGNYFVVREMSNNLFNLQLQAGETIPFAWLFWILTVLIPLLYILWGILKKDIILIRTGLVLIAAIVFTIRYYHQVWPIEIVMIIGGVFLIAIAYLLTLILKLPKAGFTSQPLVSKYNDGLQNIESVIIAETMASSSEQVAGNFGGGSLGGGGASGEY